MILFHQQMEQWDITLILEREQLLPSHVMMDSVLQLSLLPLVLTLDCGSHHHIYITAHLSQVINLETIHSSILDIYNFLDFSIC